MPSLAKPRIIIWKYLLNSSVTVGVFEFCALCVCVAFSTISENIERRRRAAVSGSRSGANTPSLLHFSMMLLIFSMIALTDFVLLCSSSV